MWGGGSKIFKITTSFLGRGHRKYDIVRYGGRGGQKTRKKVRRLLWTAPYEYLSYFKYITKLPKMLLEGEEKFFLNQVIITHFQI